MFDAIFKFADKIIVKCENKLCYRYEYTDIWHRFTRNVDEEIILVSAASNDSNTRYCDSPCFDFSYCINCDSMEIKKMLCRESGTSENHFHLKGSSPYFYVSWIYLMNHVDNMEFEEKINKLDRDPLYTSGKHKKPEGLAFLWRVAAAIRLYLYCECLDFDGVQAFKWLDKFFYHSQNMLRSYIFQDRSYDTNYNQLQKLIDVSFYGDKHNGECLHPASHEYIDYAQMHKRVLPFVHTKYFNLQGERNLLRESLRLLRCEGRNNERIADLLYIYLAIKQRFYQELVQCNQRIGFYNFAEYQNRKSYFMPRSYESKRSVVTDTICSILDDVKIHKVELRIAPEDTVEEMKETIQMYDDAIQKAILFFNDLDVTYTDFFYTFHFIKIPDREPLEHVCRNHEAREMARKQSDVITEMCICGASHNGDAGSSDNEERILRIYGIDACAEEMDCRPEAFAPIFRYLQHCFPEKLDHQIKATYHVAEDNYDIIDGIRAIDEAVLFCDLRSGSRLGHATLLGMDAEKYYQSKNNQITIPIQNWLDNVVWLYYYIKENNIIFAGSALLLDYLRQEFEKSFHEVYLQALSSDYVKNLLMERNVFEPCFDIEQYFCSWLLRGDEPDLYKTGFADMRFYRRDKYSFCYSSDKIDHARESAEANYLYYLYHFRKSVKEKGGRFIIKSLPEYYISGVIYAQKKMCSYIASMGICIETNPTSNLLISSINSYTEHPISKFYCNGLNSTDNETQLNISVNTDDKGVFSTSLSNEYSYLLFNLEQIKDAEGKQKYSRFQLLKWLDEIRRMGNEQSFAN